MMAKRQKKALPQNQVSSRYEGFPEHNPSHYAVLSASADGAIQVTTLSTLHAATTFSQPMSRNSMSLTEAEQAISDQRTHMSRYMMHKKSKGRLMGKLQMGEEEEDDIMADLAFKNRRGAGSSARRELLSDMADEEVKVDDDGVLGGTNDAEFGGRRHFGQLRKDNHGNKNAAGKVGGGAVGNDGLAMADDFYQRDVVAEYEDLDYDANEQFEDDDVDMGEKEEHLNSNTGFAEPDTDEDDEVYDDSEGGAEGLATVAGFKKMLAKARGETADALEAPDDKEGKKDGSRPSSPQTAPVAKKEATVNDPLASVFAGAEKVAQSANKEPSTKKPKKDTGVQLDKQGRRVLTLEAVQKEIWLNHGSIEVNRLAKTFGVKKKDKERYKDFLEIVKTLCTFEKDEMGKPILVLKQHYKKMG